MRSPSRAAPAGRRRLAVAVIAIVAQQLVGAPRVVVGTVTASAAGRTRAALDLTDQPPPGRGGGGALPLPPPGGPRLWFPANPAFLGDPETFSTTAIGDVDGDGHLDVVAAPYNRQVYALDRFGHDLPGWPFSRLADT